MKITKKQIKALDKGGTTVRELFPEVFETKLEDNTYYIFGTGEIQFNVNNGEGYGFNKYGFQEEARWLKYPHNGSYRKATKEEVETALINEAKRRGFNNGAIVSKTGINKRYTFKFQPIREERIRFFENPNVLDSGQGELFRDGVWAEIIKPKQMTKEEIEKELGYQIEIV